MKPARGVAMVSDMEAPRCPVCAALQGLLFRYREHNYHRCRGCGLVSTYPYPDRAAIEAHYANRYQEGNYRALRDNADRYRPVYEGLADTYLGDGARLGFRPEGARLLDIGCFTGGFLDVMAARGLDVHGVELQAEARAEAERRFPGRIFPADLAESTLPPMTFDAVSMNAVIEHVADPVKLLDRARGILKPGGLLLIETPDSSSLFARMLGRYWMPYAPVEHIHLFSRRSLKLLLKQAGFESVRIHRHWKFLPLRYALEILGSLRPELRGLVDLAKRAPARVLQPALPFYIGEMVATARKVQCPS